jgi:hypothetical protein
MPSTDRMLELTAKQRWLNRLTAGCVFQWVKRQAKVCNTYKNTVMMRGGNMKLS